MRLLQECFQHLRLLPRPPRLLQLLPPPPPRPLQLFFSSLPLLFLPLLFWLPQRLVLFLHRLLLFLLPLFLLRALVRPDLPLWQALVVRHWSLFLFEPARFVLRFLPFLLLAPRSLF